jgi:glyoxylase-like metal-dependent hydrolase (beta-lactamase superfamily II)
MLQVFSMPCGFLELDSKLFFPDQETGSPLVVPVPCYLLTHPQDYDHPLNYQAVDGEQDIFGDGSLVIIPTHGHTPGHQSLRVRVSKGTEIVLTGDACYTRGNMDQDLLPSVAVDESEMYQSLGRLRALRDKEGATIIYGHDPDQWKEIPHAPEPLA